MSMEEMKGCSYAAGGVGGCGRGRQGSLSGVIRTMGRVVSSNVHITLGTYVTLSPFYQKKDLFINAILFITTESTNFLFQNLFIDGVGGRKYHAHIDVFDIIVHIFQICFVMNVFGISFP